MGSEASPPSGSSLVKDGLTVASSSQYGSIESSPLTPNSKQSSNPLNPPTPAVRQRSLKGSISKSSDSSGPPTPQNSASDLERQPVLKKSSTIDSEKQLRINLQQELAREIAERNKNLAARLAAGVATTPSTTASPSNNTTTQPEQPAKQANQTMNSPENSDSPTYLGPATKGNPLSLMTLEPPIASGSGPNEPNIIQSSSFTRRPYPKRVFFIVANEFCERFSFYGLRTVLVLYFKSVIGFSDSNSTIAYHMFTSLCYLTPILGAILGDSVWGKFKTIFYLSVVYLAGELILLASSVVWYDDLWAKLFTLFGLLLIGIGTGGIKPCVSAFGGDQFEAHEESRRQMFFSIFYGAINLGSLISMFVTPILRSRHQCVGRLDCYPLAFGLPCLLMFISLGVFLLARRKYTKKPLPERNIILAFVQCVWLALRRKLTRSSTSSIDGLVPTGRESYAQRGSKGSMVASKRPSQASASSTNSSVTSVDESSLEQMQNQSSQNLMRRSSSGVISSLQDRSHWLYLAKDQFDTQSIESFRSVLSILLLLLPIPVYWCLYDQQGSLWTLQASRMDGSIPGTNFVLVPDQISVANPILLLAAIPVFEAFVYPSLRAYNLLTSPISRITAGGLLAAASFVTSGLIEMRIQQFAPSELAIVGHANLMLVNGLPECSMINTSLSYMHLDPSTSAEDVDQSKLNWDQLQTIKFSEELQPLELARQVIKSQGNSSSLSGYKFRFHLAPTSNHPSASCPYDPKLEYELRIRPFEDRTSKLLYLVGGNGMLNLTEFDESQALGPEGKARLVLLYEPFGSVTLGDKRRFHITSSSQLKLNEAQRPKGHQRNSSSTDFMPDGTFSMLPRRSPVLSISRYLDLSAPSDGSFYELGSSDPHLKLENSQIQLKSGTRNLIIITQRNSTSAHVKHLLFQDNDYRISMLWQLAPYTLISVSEVMFSITGLEFSYSMSPDNMKSIILAAWFLTTAAGNLLTVAVEAIHPFSNVVHDFLFYAAILTLDMLVFAVLAKYYKPYKPQAEGAEHDQRPALA